MALSSAIGLIVPAYLRDEKMGFHILYLRDLNDLEQLVVARSNHH